MKLLALALLAAPLLAQNPVLNLSSPPAVQGGASVDIALSTTSPAASGYGWTFTAPVGALINSAATALTNKQLSCKPGNTTCIVLGTAAGSLNAAAIPAGPIATYNIKMPAAPGTYQFAVTVLSAVTPAGANLSVTAGTPGTGIVSPPPSPFDLSGNGVLDHADLGVWISQWRGDVVCSSPDFNGDGTPCSLGDGQALIAGLLAAGVQ